MTRLERVDKRDIASTNRVYSLALSLGEPDGINPNIKQQNFDQLIKIADLCSASLTGASVLDVGCGTGDDYPRFSGKGVAQYRGVDISWSVLAEARRKYPEGDFVEEDIIATTPAEMFDFVVASGTMSLRQIAADNYDFMESMLHAMWQRARHGIAFNFYPDNNQVQPRNLFFYTQDRVRTLCSAVAGEDALILLRETNTFSAGDGALTNRITAYIIRDGMLPSPSTQASQGV